MELFSRECTLFYISNKFHSPPETVKISSFEEFNLFEKCKSYEIGEYTWVDTVRFKDKIISRNKKHVAIVYFKENSLCALFSNSESDVAFVSGQLNKLFSFKLEKKFIFDEVITSLKNNDYKLKFPNLTSVQFRIKVDEEIDREVTSDVSKIHREQILYLLDTQKIFNTNFTTSFKVHFDLDCSSVFSFHDNSTLEEIINVLESYI
ncbi:hypothetical protein BSK54_14830 [Paenibacillus odorifer]|uniref:hypothetical protein n=1 Tax=Paenibacillus odorifer TaxID=189426 RepID=UPI00096C33A7|nr:hypothetical protein [Paenibacillus odorifer]OME01128.1 hypothetical protein BSK54_14830 [Paenibacillus odorifer]